MRSKRKENLRPERTSPPGPMKLQEKQQNTEKEKAEANSKLKINYLNAEILPNHLTEKY